MDSYVQGFLFYFTLICSEYPGQKHKTHKEHATLLHSTPMEAAAWSLENDT